MTDDNDWFDASLPVEGPALGNAELTVEHRVVYAPEWDKGKEHTYTGSYEDFYHYMEGSTGSFVREEKREVITVRGNWEEV